MQQTPPPNNPQYFAGNIPLKPVVFWLPDMSCRNLLTECDRQAHLTFQADHHDPQLIEFMDKALVDILDAE